jgi:Undecaprenyl-phosphate glucose phosphotransferase
MLRQQHRFLRSVLIAADGVVVIAASLLAYWIRFEMMEPPAELPGAGPASYVTRAIPAWVAVPILILSMLWAGLYRPRRDQRFYGEATAILKACTVGVVLIIVFMTLLRNPLFDGRLYNARQYGVFFICAAAFLLCWRFSFRVGLRVLRAKGFNLRHVAIIGNGRLGQVVARTLSRNSWTGIKPAYFVSHHARPRKTQCGGIPVFGGLDDLERILDEREVSGVFIAVPGRMIANLPQLIARLERYPLAVRIVPDMNPKFLPMNMAAGELEGMPVLSMRESPLAGWGAVTKRTVDVAGSLAALTIFALPMLLIGFLIRFEGGAGSVIFRQERMSLGGQRFRIFKFRTMRHAEQEEADCVAVHGQGLDIRPSGTDAWTKPDDPRITPIGRFLRRTSLDELPQLFNVLLGEMSLVGPRPERPELIERFREDWRGYMLRQNVKAGMTGWAQINGLRGNCSLRKRLQYDLFYIRNWSLAFDLRILWITLFRGFANPNAY